jgi:hypothetical protein
MSPVLFVVTVGFVLEPTLFSTLKLGLAVVVVAVTMPGSRFTNLLLSKPKCAIL